MCNLGVSEPTLSPVIAENINFTIVCASAPCADVMEPPDTVIVRTSTVKAAAHMHVVKLQQSLED